MLQDHLLVLAQGVLWQRAAVGSVHFVTTVPFAVAFLKCASEFPAPQLPPSRLEFCLWRERRRPLGAAGSLLLSAPRDDCAQAHTMWVFLPCLFQGEICCCNTESSGQAKKKVSYQSSVLRSGYFTCLC